MISGNGTFSANVRLNLYVGAARFELGHLGPDFALLGDAQNIDATEGELETIIDGKSARWKVRFTSPITSSSKRFTFEAASNQ
jgi:hypothetical protein